MNLDKEKENIHEKTPSKRINDLKNIIGEQYEIKPRGYLVCNSCYGYYKLKNNESPEDFSACECSGSLEYYKNISELEKTYNTPTNTSFDYKSTDYYDEYEELEKIVDVIKTKAHERKKFLKNLSESITTQEKLLKEIKSGQFKEVSTDDWSLWNVIEKNDINNEIKDQKMIIDEIMDQENKLLAHVREKRENEFMVSSDLLKSYTLRIWIVICLAVVFTIMVIYVLK